MSLWNPTAEKMPHRELRTLQFDKLKALVNRVYNESPYYNHKLAAAGVSPEHLKSLEHYHDFPFFDKDEERLSQEKSKEGLGHPFGMHITCDPKLVNRFSSSSGTTGSPTFSGFTKFDRAIAAENTARGLKRIGIEPGDVVLHASVFSMWIAGVPAVDSMLAYGACVVPVGALSGVERVAQIAKQTRPRMIRTTVSFARHLAATMQDRAGIDPTSLGIEKVVVTGEPGGSIPEIFGEIEAGFGGATVYDNMGATGCHSPTGISCEAHAGIHFYAEDNAYFEIVDPDTLKPMPIENGVEGEIIFTGLERECEPLLRWRDKDITKINTDSCECGRPGVRMTFKGRVDDMLLIKGVNVFPNAVRDVVNRHSSKTTGNIRTILQKPGPVAEPPIPILVEHVRNLSTAQLTELRNKLENAIHHQLRFRAKIEFQSEDHFELKTGVTGKSKLVEVLNS